MSEINYQALREVAERAIPAMERLLMLPADDDLLSEQELKDYGVDIDALNVFKFLTGPETVLALLDERERNQQYVKRRDQENEEIALAVGKLRVELEGKDSKIANLTAERDALREGEMGDARHSNTRAAADIYFQLVEECDSWLNPPQNAKPRSALGSPPPVSAKLNWCWISRSRKCWRGTAPPGDLVAIPMKWPSTSRC